MMGSSHSEPIKQSQELHNADFSDMHLRVGEPLIIQPLGVAEDSNFTVSYIGAFGRASFLTSLPKVDGKGIWVPPGSRFSIRVIHGMYAYAFTSSSLRAHNRPYPYVHFVMPETVKYRQIRQSHRLEIRLPAELCRADGTRTLGIMRDISEHGAKLELTGMLGEVGEKVTLSIPILLPDMVKSLLVSASIRNTSNLDRSISSGRFLFGVHFAPLAEAEANLLQRFIEHLLVEQLA